MLSTTERAETPEEASLEAGRETERERRRRRRPDVVSLATAGTAGPALSSSYLWPPRRRPRRVLRQSERLQGPQGPPRRFPGRGGGVEQLLERGRGPVAAAAAAAAAAERAPSSPGPHGRERLQVGIRGRVRVGEAAREDRVEERGAHLFSFPFFFRGSRFGSPLYRALSCAFSLLLPPLEGGRGSKRKGALSGREEEEEGDEEERFPGVGPLSSPKKSREGAAREEKKE